MIIQVMRSKISNTVQVSGSDETCLAPKLSFESAGGKKGAAFFNHNLQLTTSHPIVRNRQMDRLFFWLWTWNLVRHGLAYTLNQIWTDNIDNAITQNRMQLVVLRTQSRFWTCIFSSCQTVPLRSCWTTKNKNRFAETYAMHRVNKFILVYMCIQTTTWTKHFFWERHLCAKTVSVEPVRDNTICAMKPMIIEFSETSQFQTQL